MKTALKVTAWIAVCFVVLGGGSCFAQDAGDGKFFRLDFVVKEVEDGRVVNTRNYSTILSTAKDASYPSIRTGSKVPVQQGSDSQFTFIDVGISFDCKSPTVVGNTLTIGTLVAEVSSYIPSDAEGNLKRLTVVRQNRWSAPVVVALRKPTTVFSSDDLSSKRKMQVELTATPMAP